MTLTRRGLGVVTTALLAFAIGLLFGPRALDAVAVPLLVALLLGAAIVRLPDAPAVELQAPEPGFPGDERTLSLSAEGSGVATIGVELPEGTEEEKLDVASRLPAETTLELTLADRGVYRLGPPTVVRRDPLGLFVRRETLSARAELVVYPERGGIGGRTLDALLTETAGAERQEFDRLREYVPGDALQHVDWKSSAKHDRFYVTEYAAAGRTKSVEIAATAESGREDEMAQVVATVATAALDAGHEVGLRLPDGRVAPGRGWQHRERLYRLLAETEGGRMRDELLSAVDVRIRAGTGGEITVEVGSEQRSVTTLAGEEVTG